MGAKNFKTLLLLQIAAESFQTFPEFSSQWSSQTKFGIFEILIFWFLTIFFFENFKFTIVAYGEIENFNYLENEQS